VAADIIKKYDGKTWEQSLQKRIFDSLGMSNSSADKQSFLNASDVSSLHTLEGDKVIALPKNWDFLDWSYVAGPAGAINSNILDMAKWLTFQMNNGKVNDKQLVSVANMQVIHSPKTIIGSGGEVHNNIFCCLGWIYMENSPFPIIWHNGGTLMKTMIAYVPNKNQESSSFPIMLQGCLSCWLSGFLISMPVSKPRI
jgi:CubicO group peptidase (beta-lactamase class C family)